LSFLQVYSGKKIPPIFFPTKGKWCDRRAHKTGQSAMSGTTGHPVVDSRNSDLPPLSFHRLRAALIQNQGDRIGRIFTHWMIVNFGQFFQ
jgi:hypothetical protein